MGGLIEAQDYQLVWTVDMEQRWPGLKLEIDLLLREAAVQSTHIYCPDIMKMPISCAWVQCSGPGTDGNGLAVSWPPASSRLLMTHSAA